MELVARGIGGILHGPPGSDPGDIRSLRSAVPHADLHHVSTDERPDALRRAGQDQVTGLQRHGPADVAEETGNFEERTELAQP